MRFIALTTIAALAIASVSALPVDPSNGVPPKDITLSKRTDELNGNPAPVDASGSGQSNGGRGISQSKMGDAPQGQKPPSKRTDQVDNAAPHPDPPVAGNGISQAKMGDASQGQDSLSKRTDQVNGDLPLGNGQATNNSGAATGAPNQTSDPAYDGSEAPPPEEGGEY
jgi:hypothetical protein